MTGWIKLYRKFNDTSFKNKPLVVALFVHLLLNANHRDNKIIWNKKELTIQKGQLITGIKSLSQQTGLSFQSIRTALETLKSTNTITTQSTNKFTIVSILNWSKYQNEPTSKSTSGLTNKQQTSNKQATTNKNDKNDKNNILGFDKPKTFSSKVKIRKQTSFPRADYSLILQEYQRLKGMTLQGNEYLPVEQVIKSMFLADRSVAQILAAMRYVSQQDYTDWTIRTVQMKLPEILPKLDYQLKREQREAVLAATQKVEAEQTPEERQKAQEKLNEIRKKLKEKWS